FWPLHQPARLHHPFRAGVGSRYGERTGSAGLSHRNVALRRDQGFRPRLQGRRDRSDEVLHPRENLFAALVGPRMSKLESATIADGSIHLGWSDPATASFAFFWLRDNCRCAKCRHPGNGQKLYEIVDLPADLAAIEAMVAPDHSVKVLWSDGH